MDQTEKPYDLFVIDDALIDQFYHCSDDHLDACGLVKGSSTLNSQAELARYTDGLTKVMQMAGGGAANTATQMQRHGATTAFCGTLGGGEFGKLFRDDLVQSGIDLYEIPSRDPGATGRCVALLAPDGERTMPTCLPHSMPITCDDLDRTPLTRSKIVMSQGYRWAADTKEALTHAFDVTRASGGKVAFSLSAASCVDQHRDDFLDLIHGKIDILFGNEKEIPALFPGKTLHQILPLLTQISASGQCTTIAITLGRHGSIVIDHGIIHRMQSPSVPKEKIVDTTGAGDAYAAGMLFGMTHDMPIEKAAELGGQLGAETIQHLGARPLATPPSATIHATHPDTRGPDLSAQPDIAAQL